ncbi:hypothetical protein CC1G_08536 [Coprinopsis cinerea okayama7|uniref:Uncharacterized protein n=1 Tax=Coprinopsis cinerea (strain Okayama-7 / 130 / ATCC MYA-4618 / FGSC 9003) TaxID=240176 RepID=A8ND61_COPC7|nr:hypothetical protein CC1G_08536 [Coprinopsis cinerea okayama7\|eukprot:XP_001832708.2 hypothetical protein CC1G_08536 [Coprinopsis cinerea okayama7\
MTNASTKTKADMPAPTSKEAPKWKGKARKLGEFWARFEEYATSCNVPVADKAEIALRYVVKDKDKEIWEAVPGYPAEYERWKNGVNGLYSEDEKKARRSLAELAKFIEKSRKKKIRKESDLTSYYREFLWLAHPLKTAGTLPEAMMNKEFWFGLHKKAREEINARLTVTKENWDRKNAPTIEEPLEVSVSPFVERLGFGLFKLRFGFEDLVRFGQRLRGREEERRRKRRKEKDREDEVTTKRVAFETPKAKVDDSKRFDDIKDITRRLTGLNVTDSNYAVLLRLQVARE